MKFIDLTIPLGVATPPWPTYEPLQLKYFKRLAPNGANGQLLIHSNHLGTHLDGEIHFHTPGKDIASLDMAFLVHEAAIVDLSDVSGDYDVYTSKMVEERVPVKEGDILENVFSTAGSKLLSVKNGGISGSREALCGP